MSDRVIVVEDNNQLLFCLFVSLYVCFCLCVVSFIAAALSKRVSVVEDNDQLSEPELLLCLPPTYLPSRPTLPPPANHTLMAFFYPGFLLTLGCVHYWCWVQSVRIVGLFFLRALTAS